MSFPELSSNAVTLYKPLNEFRSEIRIIKIHPTADHYSIVEVSLTATDLDSAISKGFVALSYVWGDPTDVQPIRINGTQACVTSSLAAFLRHLRQFWNGKQDQPFWVDAICINQANLAERTSQIRYMHKIYSSAQMTACWLGNFTNDGFAYELLETINENFKDEDYRENINADNWMARYPQFWSEDCEAGSRNTYWNAVQQLLSSDYFSRVWTFSEVVLSPHPYMVFGSFFLSFGHFSTILEWWRILRRESHLHFEHLQFTIREWLAAPNLNVSKMNGVHHARRQFEPFDLHFLLTGNINLQTSDPRDHIFGFLGLMQTSMVADYASPTYDMFRMVPLIYWKEVKTLQILEFAGLSLRATDNTLNLPSWAPDWQFLSKDEAQYNLFIDSSVFSACHGFHSRSTGFDISTGTLRVPALICDELDSFVTWPLGSANQAASDIIDYVEKSGQLASNGGLPLTQVLFRSDLVDAYPPECQPEDIAINEQRLSSHAAETHDLVLSFLINLLVRESELISRPFEPLFMQLSRFGFDTGEAFLESYKEIVWGANVTVPQQQDWPDAETAVENVVRSGVPERTRYGVPGMLWAGISRTAFWTKDRYFGLCDGALKGDVLAVMADCSVPLILRKRQERRYQLIGPAFVLGYMDGEAMQKVNNGSTDITTIEIF